jgi:uncharacterized membrane protein YfcA
MAFDAIEFVIIISAFFFAAFVKGTTGLGFSTTALPFLVLALGLKETLPLLIIPSVTSNIIVMRDAGGFRPALRQFWPLFLAALPGLVLGLFLLAWLDPVISAGILGLVLIGYCLIALAQPELRLRAKLVTPLQVPVGLINGVFNGLTGSQVMPALPYLMSLHLPADRFVQTINILFTSSSLVMAVGLTKLGLMTPATLVISVIGLVPVFVGVRLGGRLRRWLSPDHFRVSVLAVLLVLGISMAVRSMLQF